MKLAFLTNFYNHHQKPLADALFAMLGDDYYFIETEKISEERLKMGWGREEKPSYVLNNYISTEAKEKCQQIVNSADVVILGNASYSLVKPRLKANKLTFIYCERLYKKGLPLLKMPLYFIRSLKKYAPFKNFYVLCASAYCALDFSRTLSFIGKTYKWGYFTELKRYKDIDRVIAEKRPASILWVARFIDWKHPQVMIELAKKLRNDGYSFEINMIGNGELEQDVRNSIEREGLHDCVNLLGTMPPSQVRANMEKSEIFLLTSDRNEGWGAVLNEAMNSACAVVSSNRTGAAPFLIENGQNGYMYKDGDIDDLYNKVKLLLDNAEERKRLSRNAYTTIEAEWNAENAAIKLIDISNRALNGEYKPFPFKSGVCSKAGLRAVKIK